jgi:RNA polymerase sigma-70 factor, ECF subfamily
MRQPRLLRADTAPAPAPGTVAPPAPLPTPRPWNPEQSGPLSRGPVAVPAPPTPHHDDRRVPAGGGRDEAVTALPQQTPDGDRDSGAWALVRAAQGGDMNAYGQLFEQYMDVVFKFVLFRTGDRALAEDLTSETFARALRRIGSVSYQGRDIGAWFVTIARNLIFDHVKSSRYRLEQTTADMVDHAPSTGGPEQQVIEGAITEELMKGVAKLNPDQQECIHLRFLQGLSVAETARIMDRNEGAVKALQHRAVRRLAQLVPEELR